MFEDEDYALRAKAAGLARRLDSRGLRSPRLSCVDRQTAPDRRLHAAGEIESGPIRGEMGHLLGASPRPTGSRAQPREPRFFTRSRHLDRGRFGRPPFSEPGGCHRVCHRSATTRGPFPWLRTGGQRLGHRARWAGARSTDLQHRVSKAPSIRSTCGVQTSPPTTQTTHMPAPPDFRRGRRSTRAIETGRSRSRRSWPAENPSESPRSGDDVAEEPYVPSPGNRAVTAPDFVIIGTQRGGTTSLHAYLGAHPQVQTPATKELHFITDRYERGLDWYLGQFPAELAPDVITGEATPYALFHPLAPRRLREIAPAARLIALLRNPVDRAYSQYLLERSARS